jgi:hypothetical protein
VVVVVSAVPRRSRGGDLIQTTQAVFEMFVLPAPFSLAS